MSDKPKLTVTIKKYANRRLYNTATSTYVTLDDLSKMVREDIEFNVYDAKSGDDITRSVLTQIIVEEEGKDGQNLLPTNFLRQLISFYGDNMQWVVPKYLEHSMEALAKNQEQIRSYFQTTFGTMFPFGSTFEEMGKQNMAMFERTMRMFTPFAAMNATPGQAAPSMAPAPQTTSRENAPSAPQAATVSSLATATPSAKKKPENKPAPTAEIDDAEGEAAFTPSPMVKAVASVGSMAMAMPTPATTTAIAQSAPSDDVQNKIAALQRQLAELAKAK